MDMENYRIQLQRNQQVVFEMRLQGLIRHACSDSKGVIRMTEDGALIRGVVSRVTCKCGWQRFNDGTRCKNVACQRYFEARIYDSILNQEEDARV